MKTNKINSTSFGTRPLIGEVSAHNGLRKFNKNLADGIADAFEKLSANNEDNGLLVHIGQNTKKPLTDVITVFYSVKDPETKSLYLTKNYAELDPEKLQDIPAKDISKKLSSVYSKLKRTQKATELKQLKSSEYSAAPITEAHEKSINKLKTKYGIDDWASFDKFYKIQLKKH